MNATLLRLYTLVVVFIPLLIGAVFYAKLRHDGLGFLVGYLTGLLVVLALPQLLLGGLAALG